VPSKIAGEASLQRPFHFLFRHPVSPVVRREEHTYIAAHDLLVLILEDILGASIPQPDHAIEVSDDDPVPAWAIEDGLQKLGSVHSNVHTTSPDSDM